ncbi:MAG: MarR family transcriptional regulator [Blastocatellia bacterium]
MSTLLEELKQQKPFSSIYEQVFLEVLVTAERLKTESTEIFKDFDLTPTQYNVLRILRGAGAEGLACREIADRMITRDSDITRLLDRLESRGLITRERQTADRRIVRAFISEKGLDVLGELDWPVSNWHAARVSDLTDDEIKTLIDLLEKLRNAKKKEIEG